MHTTPIVLFVYNRPAHTRRTVEALQKNFLAKDSDLVIFSDAPKTPDAANGVSEVRNYIRMISGFRSVSVVERDTNWGLAKSIIDGVTTVVNKHGRVIVLEDDLVTSPYFLTFMNEALETYQDDENVMHISGYMFPVTDAALPETFFLRPTTCWGWATWERAWKHFSRNPDELVRKFSRNDIYRFNLEGSYDYWSHVLQNQRGLINSWAIFWYASVFMKGGLCLHPRVSMVSNVGHDNSGTHCGESDTFAVQLASKPVEYFERSIIENPTALEKVKVFLRPTRITFFSRLKNALKRRFFKNKP